MSETGQPATPVATQSPPATHSIPSTTEKSQGSSVNSQVSQTSAKSKNSPKSQTIQFVSFISRNDKPLYIQSFGLVLSTSSESDSSSSPSFDAENANKFLKYNFLSHMALDIFSSPASLSMREQQSHLAEAASGVLLLFIQDEIAVYGYETNNGLKVVVGISNSPSISESNSHRNIKNLFLDIQKCYLRTICNPFNNLGSDVDINENETILQTPTFDTNIKRIVNRWNEL